MSAAARCRETPASPRSYRYREASVARRILDDTKVLDKNLNGVAPRVAPSACGMRFSGNSPAKAAISGSPHRPAADRVSAGRQRESPPRRRRVRTVAAAIQNDIKALVDGRMAPEQHLNRAGASRWAAATHADAPRHSSSARAVSLRCVSTMSISAHEKKHAALTTGPMTDCLRSISKYMAMPRLSSDPVAD